MRQQFTQESDFRQMRDFGQKISASFDFIAEHWRGLGKSLLYIVLPAAIVQGILSGLVQQNFLGDATRIAQARMGSSPLRSMALFANLYQSPIYWLNVAVSGIFITMLVLTVYSYVKCCLRPVPSPEPIGPGQVWSIIKQEFLGAYFSYFGLLIVVVVGFFLLFVPGLYLSVGLSLFFIVKVVEQTDFGTTISRCLQLVRGKWWSTFGLLVVMFFIVGIIMTIVGGVFGWLTLLLGQQAGLYQSGDSNNSLGLFMVVATAIGGLLNLLIYPPILLALAFQYFNLVELHEGVGLRNMVNQLGQAPAPVQNAAYKADDEGEY
jgi:hypothetical protein